MPTIPFDKRPGHHSVNLYTLIPMVAIGLRIASVGTANASFFLIAAYALLGRAQAIQALALSWLLSMISPAIAPDATQSAVGRYLVISCAAVSVFHQGAAGISRSSAATATVLLGSFMVVHSLIISPLVDVSVLKAVSWTLTMTTLIVAWSGLKVEAREVLERQIFGGLVVLMLVSLPLLASSLGYLRNGSGFQGVLGQPQVFGAAMALLGAWTVGRMLGQSSPPWKTVALSVTCLVLVVLSEARTAGLALMLGVGIAMLLTPALSRQSIRSVLPGLRSQRIFIVVAVALLGVLVAGTQVDSVLSNYISKSGRAEATDLLGAYEESRGGLIDRMLENIEEKPFLGIGFGIASYPELMVVERDSVFGLPISASIEKGVLPVAVWEETGLFGLIAVSAWVWMLLRRATYGGIAPTAVVLTALLLNMGESVLFSPSGLGMLTLVLIGWALASGRR